jgi:hypothetical protein
MGDDAAHGGIGGSKVFGPDERSDLGSSPHRKVESEALDGSNERLLHDLARGRFGRRETGSGRLCQRYSVARATPTARAAASAVSPSRRACSNRSSAPRRMAACGVGAAAMRDATRYP